MLNYELLPSLKNLSLRGAKRRSNLLEALERDINHARNTTDGHVVPKAFGTPRHDEKFSSGVYPVGTK